METPQRVRKTDLARNTRNVIQAVQHGHPAIVEHNGEPEAAILDIVDYYLLRALVRYYTSRGTSPVFGEAPPSTAADRQDRPDPGKTQRRYDQVLKEYLDSGMSLGRAAELLSLPTLDLQARLVRLDIPLRTGPSDVAEAREDVEIASSWATATHP